MCKDLVCEVVRCVGVGCGVGVTALTTILTLSAAVSCARTATRPSTNASDPVFTNGENLKQVEMEVM